MDDDSTARTPTSGALAFFPWVQLAGPLRFGEFELLPWEANDPHPPWTAPLLSAYRHGGGGPVQTATIVAVDGDLESRWSEDRIDRFFSMRELVSFTALARRRFFDPVDPHLNDHSFRAYVQRFNEGRDGGMARTTRRRDGRGITYVPEKLHRVAVPEHVSTQAGVTLDDALIAALSKGWEHDSTWRWLADAIGLFNLANTDSQEIREHMEIVLSVASIQAVLGLGGVSREVDLGRAFRDLLEETFPVSKSLADSPRTNRTGSPPADVNLRDLWFRDLYRTRGALSHGRTTPETPKRWSVSEHLLLCAHIIPLLVSIRLQADGHYELTDDDEDAVRGFDSLLCMDDCYAFKEPCPNCRSFLWRDVLFSVKKQRWNAGAVAILEGEEEG